MNNRGLRLDYREESAEENKLPRFASLICTSTGSPL